MAKPNAQRLVFGLFLIVLIVAGELILSHLKLPTWPAFVVMVLFFMEHMNIKKIPEILVGGCFGIICILPVKFIATKFGPMFGVEISVLTYVIIIVYSIVVFGEMLPILFNNYAFMFMTICFLAIRTPEPKPLIWLAVQLVGGGIFIGGIIGILKLLGAFAQRKAAKAG